MVAILSPILSHWGPNESAGSASGGFARLNQFHLLLDVNPEVFHGVELAAGGNVLDVGDAAPLAFLHLGHGLFEGVRDVDCVQFAVALTAPLWRNMGLIDPQTSDGRVIFFIPWAGAVVAGVRLCSHSISAA